MKHARQSVQGINNYMSAPISNVSDTQHRSAASIGTHGDSSTAHATIKGTSRSGSAHPHRGRDRLDDVAKRATDYERFERSLNLSTFSSVRKGMNQPTIFRNLGGGESVGMISFNKA